MDCIELSEAELSYMVVLFSAIIYPLFCDYFDRYPRLVLLRWIKHLVKMSLLFWSHFAELIIALLSSFE